MSLRPNPWDIPPQPDRGDVDENALFAEIGKALTEWEQVDAACAELFAVFVSVARSSIHHDPAIRAYGTVVSYRGRCEMLRAAADAYFHHRKKKRAAFEKRLHSLINECQAFSDRRNEIVHGHVSVAFDMRGGGSRNIGHYLLPSQYNPRKFKIKSFASYAYTTKEVIHFRQEFTKLHFKIAAFRKEIVRK
jgi:hypothetical protein